MESKGIVLAVFERDRHKWYKKYRMVNRITAEDEIMRIKKIILVLSVGGGIVGGGDRGLEGIFIFLLFSGFGEEKKGVYEFVLSFFFYLLLQFLFYFYYSFCVYIFFPSLSNTMLSLLYSWMMQK